MPDLTIRRFLRPLAVVLLVLLITLGVVRAGIEGVAAYQVREADRALEHQNYKVARTHLEEALKMRPNSPTLHLRLGRVCRQQGMLLDAEAHLKALRRLEGQTEAYQLEILMLQAEGGNLDEVYNKLYVYVKENRPEQGLVLESLVISLLNRELYRSAGSYAMQWIAKDPDNVQALYYLGVTKLNNGAAEDAVELLRRALRRDESRDNVRTALGMALIDINSFDDGAKQLEISLEHQPKDAFTTVGLAKCYMGKGQVQKAADLLDRALNDNPKSASLLTERGKIALIMGQPKEAYVWLSKALEIEPKNALALYQMEVCLSDLGRTQDAARMREARVATEKAMMRVEEIISRELPAHTTPALLHELGVLLVANGREDNGMVWLYKALEQDPQYQPTLMYLAEHFEGKGDMQRAREFRARLSHDSTEPASGPSAVGP